MIPDKAQYLAGRPVTLQLLEPELPLPLEPAALPVGAATPAAATLAPVGYGAMALEATPEAAQSPLVPLELMSLMLAQAMRVVFRSWMTMLRLPTKAASPGVVEVKRSTYTCCHGLVVILPNLPARSPTWQEAGSLGSQGGCSPRPVGSRWASAVAQEPLAATGWVWMW